MEVYATKDELYHTEIRLNEKNKEQDNKIEQNRNNIAINDIQTHKLIVSVDKLESTIDKFAKTVSTIGITMMGSLILPIMVAAVVFFIFKG